MLTGTLLDAERSPLSGATVILQSSCDGGRTYSTAKTLVADRNGHVRASVKPISKTTYRFTYAGDGSDMGCSSSPRTIASTAVSKDFALPANWTTFKGRVYWRNLALSAGKHQLLASCISSVDVVGANWRILGIRAENGSGPYNAQFKAESLGRGDPYDGVPLLLRAEPTGPHAARHHLVIRPWPGRGEEPRVATGILGVWSRAAPPAACSPTSASPKGPMHLRRIWNPAEYQGAGVTRRYFEGWYFKQVDAAADQAVAIIPGVSYSADGAACHAFVQVVPSGGPSRRTSRIRSSRPSPTPSAGSRSRSARTRSAPRGCRWTSMTASTASRGGSALSAWSPWPVTPLSPGIMGWYRFVPRMETYHGVLSMDHALTGSLTIDGAVTAFDGGRGYVEKNWGRSFRAPQSGRSRNSFSRPGASLMLSVAKSRDTGAFVGNIEGLLVDGRLHRFATYTGARLTRLEIGANEAVVVLADAREELEIHLRGCAALTLKAPVLGSMEGRDAESLGGGVDVVLRSRARAAAPGRGVIFEGTGTMAGVEIVDAAGELHAGRQERARLELVARRPVQLDVPMTRGAVHREAHGNRVRHRGDVSTSMSPTDGTCCRRTAGRTRTCRRS